MSDATIRTIAICITIVIVVLFGLVGAVDIAQELACT